MDRSSWAQFSRIVVLDTEFNGHYHGDRQNVVALVAQVYSEDRCVQTVRIFEGEFRRYPSNPLPDGEDVLYVTFVGQAEWKSFLSVGWKLPRKTVDLFAEARCMRNLALPKSTKERLKLRGDSLIDVCRWAGLPASDPLEQGRLPRPGQARSTLDRRRTCQDHPLLRAGRLYDRRTVFPPTRPYPSGAGTLSGPLHVRDWRHGGPGFTDGFGIQGSDHFRFKRCSESIDSTIRRVRTVR
jgi:hypothetical protein